MHVMILLKQQPFPKKGIAFKKAKISKETSSFSQKLPFISEFFKKLGSTNPFPQIRGQFLPFLPSYAA